MKLQHFILAVLVLGSACNSPKDMGEKSLPLQVAEAYGYDSFEKVSSMEYTWNVRVDSATVRSRSWKWVPGSGEVAYTGQDTSLTYMQSDKGSALDEIDSRFVNDKYWLLFPFQLAWDEGYEHEVTADQPAPISGDNTTKLTIVYDSEKGYTPGDAYDLYLDDTHKIKEWVFRRGNGKEGRAMTWENVTDYKGVKIALDHKDDKGNKVLWFSDVVVDTQ